LFLRWLKLTVKTAVHFGRAKYERCAIYQLQIFGNEDNKSKPDSGGNEEESEFGECSLPFSAEYLVFLPAVLKHGT
jgi:hypothetical protein